MSPPGASSEDPLRIADPALSELCEIPVELYILYEDERLCRVPRGSSAGRRVEASPEPGRVAPALEQVEELGQAGTARREDGAESILARPYGILPQLRQRLGRRPRLSHLLCCRCCSSSSSSCSCTGRSLLSPNRSSLAACYGRASMTGCG